MWFVYVLLGLAALLVLVISVPIYGRIAYDGDLSVKIWVLGIPIPLLPRSQQTEATASAAKGRKKPTDKPSKTRELLDLLRQDDVGGTVRFVCNVAALAGRTVGRLLRAITVNRLQLQLLVATGDPADTAQLYGQVCGVLYPALELIGHTVRIRRRDIRVEPNFLLERGSARFDVRLQVSLWRLLGAAIALLWGFLMWREATPQKSKEVS